MRRQQVNLFARGRTLRYWFRSSFMRTRCVVGTDRILLESQLACRLNLNSRVKMRLGLLDVDF